MNTHRRIKKQQEIIFSKIKNVTMRKFFKNLKKFKKTIRRFKSLSWNFLEKNPIDFHNLRNIPHYRGFALFMLSTTHLRTLQNIYKIF